MTTTIPARARTTLWLRVFLPFALGYYVSYLFRTVNAVIAPDLTRELGLSAADLGLLTSAYFLAFGAFQIPLGILLDRYGPRRVEAALLLFAAAGSALFAAGASLLQLGAARAAIGLGVAACLMASFKSFHQWFAAERQPALVGAIMVAGTLGALSASLPLEALLPLIGWRGVFAGLAVSTLLVAALILTVPEHRAGLAAEPWGAQIRGVAEVFASRALWRFAPQSALLVGGFMALQSLWAVPWLMQVNGHTRGAAAEHLFALNLALLGGYLGIATGSSWLARRGMTPLRLLATGSGLSVALGLAILLDAAASLLLWPLLGLSMSVSNLAYPLVTAQFPAHMAGRVNTALNVLVFIGAFGVQWGLGAIIDAATHAGASTVTSYRLALALLVVLQTAAFLWFAFQSFFRQDHLSVVEP